MSIENKSDFPVAGGLCSAPPGARPSPVRAGGGDAIKQWIKTELDANPVLFYPSLVAPCGGITAALLLSQLIRWAAKERKWFSRTMKEIKDSVGMSRREQDTARSKLIAEGFISEKRTGLPAKIYFTVNFDKISSATTDYLLNYDCVTIGEMKRRNKRKRASSITPRPRIILANAITKRLRGKLIGKSRTAYALSLLGCSMQELQTHIESKWKNGMTWSNYGWSGWVIDHIRPCASFDLNDAEQQKECFHYKNLQPLWAKENDKKSDNYEV